MYNDFAQTKQIGDVIMKIQKRLLFLGALVATSLVACNNTQPSKEPEVDNTHVDVFVLSGQSNMEGSTYWTHPTSKKELLKEYFEEEGMDFTPVSEGIPSVKTSFYGFYHPNGWTQAHTASPDKSTPEARLIPNFQPTKVGMGVGDRGDNPNPFFGPELGIANTIADYASEENPVHLIKCAFSGSGFKNGNYANSDPDWQSREDDPKQSLFYLLKTYTYNCLHAIEEEGKVPVIKGFIWHQGESDTANKDYQTQMETLIKDFREEFEYYAPAQESKNIAFLDCTIYDGSKNRYGKQQEVNDGINKLKNNIAAKGQLDKDDPGYEPNYIVDGTFTENGLKLEIGDDAQGGYNTYHYNTKDAYILGKAYGEIILNNNLLRDK